MKESLLFYLSRGKKILKPMKETVKVELKYLLGKRAFTLINSYRKAI